MAKVLTQTIQDQIDTKDVKISFTLTINETNYTDYLVNWSISYDKQFGSASASFTLDNNDGRFGEGGSDKMKVGYIVEFSEQYQGDATEFKKFYGTITQRSITKVQNERVIVLSCLDYISTLQFLDIDLEVEGDKVEVRNETLTPNYLPAPNDNLAQIFDFDNNAIADNPLPILIIRDKNHLTDALQYDGFEIFYQNGQLKLGSPINARYNYDIIANTYYYYKKGVYAEDVLEEILTQEDGYGNFLFNETSAQDVIDNHLTDNFLNLEGTSTDYLTPNYTDTIITIDSTLATDVSAGDTSITLISTAGFPNSGQGEINGDIFTWSGKSGNSLTGIPSTGSYSLNAHNSGDYVEYEETYVAGRVWYLTYSNLTTDLDTDDFTVPGAVVSYIDKRLGRIILNTNINTGSTVSCDVNYYFKTLQATGVELNKITFKPRELANRFEAVNKLRNYLAPNYIIRTIGDDKIWASYLYQKLSEDYDITLIQSINYMEDEDLYTRVKFWGKNKNPTNIVIGNTGASFASTGESYRGLATMSELTFDRKEGNFQVYKSSISNAGYIDATNLIPIVYINGVPVDNQLHQMIMLDVLQEVKTKTTIKSGCHGTSSESYTKIHTYYYYTIRFAHQSLEPSEPIYLYNDLGELVITIPPYDNHMDYGRGEYHVPGSRQNSTVESISTASYWVFYATNAIEIDYDKVEFKISKELIINPDESVVHATFEYWAVMIPINDIASVIDGRWDTQIQIEFFAEPPSNYPLTILDLGEIYNIQAIDMVAGFYKPDDIRKFDIDFRFSLQYSTDGTNYYYISDACCNVQLNGGESVSFEEDDLGKDFQARYLKLMIEDVGKIDFGEKDMWVVAISELAIYTDIILTSEAKLIKTTLLTQDVSPSDTTIYVVSTVGFEEPESGEDATAYIDGTAFTYTGLTSTTFTGCTLESGFTALIDDRVTTELASSTTMYDDDNLLGQLGDRLYKEIKISDDLLYEQDRLDALAKAWLEEFYKEHNKISINVLYAPYLLVGQTLKLIDTYNNIDTCYFIESISDQNGYYILTLGRYQE